MKICIVSSIGGHLTEARAFRSAYERHAHFYVLNAPTIISEDMKGKTYFITHSERDLKFFVNVWQAWGILKLERPNLILSTGAGPVVPFALVGKLLRIPTIYVEDMNRVTTPSLSGRIMYWLAGRFYYQWRTLDKYFPSAIYGGTLL